MDFEQKINDLRQIIHNSLSTLIDHDYLLVDVPYHGNIGDTLIWQGELDFLKHLPVRCLEMFSLWTDRYVDASNETIILMHGGGNFGDVWRTMQEYRLEIIKRYIRNKIIIFPQTVYYKDENLCKHDAEMMSRHPNLTICARDQISYQYLKQHFKNKILLVPDMAFCIDLNHLRSWQIPETDRVLYVQRSDHELSADSPRIKDAEVKDWPTFDSNTLPSAIFSLLIRTYRHLKFGRSIQRRLIDLYADRVVKPHYIKRGVRFVSQYRTIYTTRLHVFILAILLQKPIHIIDNSYGKNKNFYNSWLSDLEQVKLITK